MRHRPVAAHTCAASPCTLHPAPRTFPLHPAVLWRRILAPHPPAPRTTHPAPRTTHFSPFRAGQFAVLFLQNHLLAVGSFLEQLFKHLHFRFEAINLDLLLLLKTLKG
jgi:hypothetical protein